MRKQFVKIISLFSVFVLLCCPILHPAATAVSASKEVIAAKVDEKVLSAFDSGEKTVKVYIWLNDIDQQQVDKAVEQKTGLRADNLAVIDENISNELATRIVSEADNDKLTTETEKMLQAYLDRTAAQRTQERERTDLYTATRRAEAKAQYNEKSAAFLSKNSISSEKVIFNSNYAPMLILDLTKQEVNALAKREDVESVSLYNEMVFTEALTLSEGLADIEVTRIKSVSGLTGNNVKLGQLELHRCDPAGFDDRYFALDGLLATDENHAELVGSIMSGADGIANESLFYAAGIYTDLNLIPIPSTNSTYKFYYCEDSGPYARIESMLDAGVVAVNCSLTIQLDVNTTIPYYDDLCQWIDCITSQFGVTIVVAAANELDDTNDDTTLPEYRVTSPALAENVIAVGSYHIETTEEGQQINKMADYSCYVEDSTCVEKPDVVSLGEFQLPNENNEIKTYQGTSFAAPVVTGIIGLLLELRPSLSVYPHVLKSIIMASCREKALPANEDENVETMAAGLTEKQGAGIVNPYIAVSIAAHGTYGFGVLENDITTERIKFLQPITDADAINVTVTWLREVLTDETNSTGSTSVNGRHDVDFHVMSNGSILSMSTKSNTSAEMIYANFDENDNEDFEIVVRRCTTSEQDIRYAYAWSVDCMRFQYNYPFEGIGYLKNLNSSYYMEADTSALTISQQIFDGDANQMWILRRNANASTYKLQSAYGTIGSVSNSSAIANSSASAVTVSLNDDGTYSFTRTNGTTQYILGVVNSATTTGIGVEWQLKGDTVSDNQKWYFEVCAYEKGDHDLSGHINSADSRYVSRAALDLETPNTIRSFLCDVDGDGDITSADARLVSLYSSGLDP